MLYAVVGWCVLLFAVDACRLVSLVGACCALLHVVLAV